MSLVLDIKYASRLLLKTPKFAALTLFVLIGGLSISLYTFSFLYTLVYKPLPLPEGESIKRLLIATNGDGRRIPAYEFLEIRDKLENFSEIGVYDSAPLRLSIGDAGKTINASFVEPEMFNFSRTKVLLGRELSAEDMHLSANPVAVISHYTWTNEFKSDPEILGKEMRLNDELTTIVGVMPEGYGFPVSSRVWLPIPERLTKLQPESRNNIQVYARLKPGIDVSQAEAEIDQAINAVYQETSKLYDKEDGRLSASLLTFGHAQTDGDGNVMFTFFNLLAFCILLLACINTGNLLLARAIDRQKETAIRAALGAPITRLTLQIMWEGIIITLLGSVLAVLLVAELLDFTETIMHSAFGGGLAFWWHWGMDIPTLLMAVGFTFVTLFLASFIPAWRTANQDINNTLRDGTRGAQGKKAGRMTKSLVTLQIFIISILMLIGSFSAFISQFLLSIETKEDFSQIISGQILLPNDKYEKPEQQRIFFETFYNRIKSKNNATNAVVQGYFGEKQFTLDDVNMIDTGQPNYLDVIGIIGSPDFYGPKLLEGRHLDTRDNPNSQRTGLVSQSMAKRYWPNSSALDKRVKVAINDKEEWIYIVGVMEDLLEGTPAIVTSNDANDRLYVSGYQYPKRYQFINFHYIGAEEIAVESFYQVLFSLDRSIEPLRVEPAEQNRNLIKKMMKITSDLTFGIGAFALLLALTGIYGLTSNSVNRRAHEIGIRRAVGATDKDVISMFLKQGSRQLVIGLGLALLLFALMAYVFNGFSGAGIPSAIYLSLAVTVTIGLSLVVMIAVYIPTKRAVNMEPSEALRYE
ncbi:FtsX-like permease family protein [Aliikangiella sp. IMCC44653]